MGGGGVGLGGGSVGLGGVDGGGGGVSGDGAGGDADPFVPPPSSFRIRTPPLASAIYNCVQKSTSEIVFNRILLRVFSTQRL